MAIPNPLVCVPSTVPNGQTGEIDVTFIVAAGTPDKVAAVTLTSDGVVVGSGSVTLNGTPAEVTPTVSVGSTGSGWEIRTSTGTLAALATNKFTIRY